MAMNLRLPDELSTALRDQAASEQRSQNAIAADAIRDYMARHQHRERVTAAAAWVNATYAEALEELRHR